MRTITAFRPRPRQRDRYVLEIDETAFATVSLEIIERFSLHIGDVLPEGVAAQLLEEAAGVSAYDRALRMLASRGRSGHDLVQRLVQKGEKRAQAEAAVSRLRTLGLIDDAAFARGRARSKLSSGHGRRRVEQDLRHQGVDRETVRAAVTHVVEESEIDSKSQAIEVAKKRHRSLAKLDPQVQRRRLFAFLVRRGFAPDEIRAAMQAVGL